MAVASQKLLVTSILFAPQNDGGSKWINDCVTVGMNNETVGNRATETDDGGQRKNFSHTSSLMTYLRYYVDLNPCAVSVTLCAAGEVSSHMNVAGRSELRKGP